MKISSNELFLSIIYLYILSISYLYIYYIYLFSWRNSQKGIKAMIIHNLIGNNKRDIKTRSNYIYRFEEIKFGRKNAETKHRSVGSAGIH